ncbi:MAG: hypothetical protein Q7T01_04810 [bacterium]|nr:hypothetical protein [bacterium]
MHSNRRSPQFFQESLRLISYCPVCDTSYNPMEARVIDERDDKHLMHIRCKKCAHSILALVLTTGMGVSSMGLLTDLTFDDVVKFRNVESVTVDDVIAFHQLLEKREGDVFGPVRSGKKKTEKTAVKGRRN